MLSLCICVWSIMLLVREVLLGPNWLLGENIGRGMCTCLRRLSLVSRILLQLLKKTNLTFPDKALINIFYAYKCKNLHIHTFERNYEYKQIIIFMGHWWLWQCTDNCVVISFRTLGLLLFNETNLDLAVNKF